VTTVVKLAEHPEPLGTVQTMQQIELTLNIKKRKKEVSRGPLHCRYLDGA